LTNIFTREDAYSVQAAQNAERSIRTTKLEVIQYTPSDDAEKWIALPGTINFIICSEGSSLLAEIRAHVADPNSDASHIKAELSRIGGAPRASIDEVLHALQDSPVIFDVRHGAATLASSMYLLGDGDVYGITCPYNGGKFAPEGFTLVERPKEGATSSLTGFVLCFNPVLSPAEKAAVEQVPADQLELNTGFGFCTESYTGRVAFAVTLAATAAATVVGVGCAAVANQNPISAEKIAELGPAATARELLAVRRKLISNVEEKLK